MYRLLHRLYRTSSAVLEWGRKRLTFAGGSAIAFTLVVTGGGSTVEQSVGLRVALFLAALFAVGLATLPFFRGSFSAERLLPRCASVGEPVRYTVRVRNRTGRRVAGVEVLEQPADTRLDLDAFTARLRAGRRTRHFRVSRNPTRGRMARFGGAPLPALASGESATASIELTPLRRGVLRLDAVLLSRTDPFGLLRSLIRLPAPDRLVVLPRRYPVPALRMPGNPHPQPLGDTRDNRPGESDEFLGLRDYRPGDPLRRIHWRGWARTGHAITREYENERFTRHALVLDTFTDPDNGAVFEEAVSVAASFAAQDRPDGSLLDLVFVGDRAYRVAGGRGEGGGGRLLEVLAAVGPTHGRPVETLFQKVLEHLSELSGVVCVLVEWDAPRREFVRRLVRERLPLQVYLVASPREAIRLVVDPELAGTVRILRSDRVREDLAGLPDFEGGTRR